MDTRWIALAIQGQIMAVGDNRPATPRRHSELYGTEKFVVQKVSLPRHNAKMIVLFHFLNYYLTTSKCVLYVVQLIPYKQYLCRQLQECLLKIM